VPEDPDPPARPLLDALPHDATNAVEGLRLKRPLGRPNRKLAANPPPPGVKPVVRQIGIAGAAHPLAQVATQPVPVVHSLDADTCTEMLLVTTRHDLVPDLTEPLPVDLQRPNHNQVEVRR